MTTPLPNQSIDPNVQLGSLDFNEIKDSIIEHLKTQDTLKDYDYAGSALQVLLDVLAYNTLYYGHYSNMIANEMFLDSAQRIESLISLVKPLGYVVPGKISAKANVKVRHAAVEGTSIPKYTRFSANSETGAPFTFYNIEPYYLNADGEVSVQLIEAKTLIKELPLIVDQRTQKAFLIGLDVDIATITIETRDDSGVWTEWGRADNIQSGLDENSKVYWLERSELGFFVVFGGNLGANTTTQIGSQIGPNDQVRISYLKTSGESGNEVGNFSIELFDGASTETLSLSTGGADEPNLDSIRFFAPKWFASQDRAVTVEDCRALLAKEGFVGNASDPLTVYNVWGGEEMDPPMFGRVFVSINSENVVDLAVAGEQAIAVLRDKTCVTILPEFMNPEYFNVILRGTVFWDPMKTHLSRDSVLGTAINSVRNSFPQRFESDFSLANISNIVNTTNSAISTTASDFSIGIQHRIDLGLGLEAKSINFRSKLLSSDFDTSGFLAGPKYSEDIPPEQLIRLRTTGVEDSKGNQQLEGYYQTEDNLIARLPGAGSFNASSGTVNINANVASEPFDVTVTPVSPLFKVNTNMIGSLNANLTIERII